MKKFIIALMLICLVLSFVSMTCAAALKFAFMPGIADPFYFTMEKGAQAKAAELGVELIVGEYPKAWGPEYQVPILKALVARGDIDLLFTAPTSTEALIPVLKEIHDSGIPVITVILILEMEIIANQVIIISLLLLSGQITSWVGR